MLPQGTHACIARIESFAIPLPRVIVINCSHGLHICPSEFSGSIRTAVKASS